MLFFIGSGASERAFTASGDAFVRGIGFALVVSIGAFGKALA